MELRPKKKPADPLGWQGRGGGAADADAAFDVRRTGFRLEFGAVALPDTSRLAQNHSKIEQNQQGQML